MCGQHMSSPMSPGSMWMTCGCIYFGLQHLNSVIETSNYNQKRNNQVLRQNYIFLWSLGYRDFIAFLDKSWKRKILNAKLYPQQTHMQISQALSLKTSSMIYLS